MRLTGLEFEKAFQAWPGLRLGTKKQTLAVEPRSAPLRFGWGVWTQHYSCGNTSLHGTSRRSWNGLPQTKEADKAELPYHLLEQMINFQDGVKVLSELFIDL